MKAGLNIIFFFIAGLMCGIFSLFPSFIPKSELSLYALYLLLLLVGIGTGGNFRAWEIFKRTNAKIALVPLSVIIGSLMGAGLLSFWFRPGLCQF